MDIHTIYSRQFRGDRTSGWTAHILEQYRDNRIMRPRANYVGETNRKYLPIEER